MKKAIFFRKIRADLFSGKMTSEQVYGCELIISTFTGMDPRYLAYALATTYHETNKTMRPIKELGGQAYFKRMYDPFGSRPQLAKANGNTQAGDGAKYAGRGFVQLTWKDNYERAGKKLGIDLVENPDLAMDPDVAATILKYGMVEGWFTGKKLSDYFTHTRTDWKNARKIINGTDRAADIAAYAKTFDDALYEAGAPRGMFINIKDEKPLQQSSKAKAVATTSAGVVVTQTAETVASPLTTLVEALAPASSVPEVQSVITTLTLIGVGLTVLGLAWALIIRLKDGGWSWPWQKDET